MNVASELLISDLTGYISELLPINVEETKADLSEIVAKYHITQVSSYDIHPDLTEKIELFLSGKRVEGLSQITLYDYELQLNMFSKHIKKRVEDITTADIRVFLGKFEHLKTSTISTKLSVLKSFFGWLVSEEIIQRDPTVKIKPPKKEKRLPKALTIEELEMLREVCETYRQRALLEVLYATGCRLSEVQALNRDDINFQTGSILVFGKGGKEREVYLSWRAMHHLKKYLFNRLDDEPALFVTERKPYRRLSKRGIQREIEKIGKKANLQKSVHPHVLRHTFATLTLNNGASLAAVQAFLGHEDASTTQIYAQLTNEKKREEYRKYLVQ